MTRKNSILLVALILQLVLGVWIVWQNSASVNQQNKGFSLFDGVDVLLTSKINIVANSGKDSALVLQKSGSQWLLPQSVKADGERINKVLNKLVNIQRSWPVATTEESQKRFEVSDKVFQRKVTLEIAGKTYTFFMGTSPGYRQVHVRAEGSQDIYTIKLNTFDFAPDKDDWLDSNQLQVKGKITAIQTNGYTFSLDGENWQVNPSTDAVTTNKGAEIASTLNSLRLISISDMKNIDVPTEKLTVTTEAQQNLSYMLLAKDDLKYIQKEGESLVYGISKDTYNKLLPIVAK